MNRVAFVEKRRKYIPCKMKIGNRKMMQEVWLVTWSTRLPKLN